MISKLRKSTLENEGSLKASKYQQLQFLLDINEMRELFDAMGDFEIFQANALLLEGEGHFEKEAFLEVYEAYINALSEGINPDPKVYKKVFSSVFTRDLDALFRFYLDEKRYFIKLSKPVLQLQSHTLAFSKEEKKFRSMILGKNCMTWGLQISYPQIYQDPKTQEIHKLNQAKEQENTALFKSCQKALRKLSVLAPFYYEKELCQSSVRIGRNCFNWVNAHPQLKSENLSLRSLDESCSH